MIYPFELNNKDSFLYNTRQAKKSLEMRFPNLNEFIDDKMKLLHKEWRDKWENGIECPREYNRFDKYVNQKAGIKEYFHIEYDVAYILDFFRHKEILLNNEK